MYQRIPLDNGHGPEHTLGTIALMETCYTVGMELNTPHLIRLINTWIPHFWYTCHDSCHDILHTILIIKN